MLGTLKLDGYRGFDTYELTDLTRVNLLVGKNNCGKTSILEAVHFLAARGDPFVLVRSANRRGEVNDAGAEPRPGVRPDVSAATRTGRPCCMHGWHGRKLPACRTDPPSGRGTFATTVRWPGA